MAKSYKLLISLPDELVAGLRLAYPGATLAEAIRSSLRQHLDGHKLARDPDKLAAAVEKLKAERQHETAEREARLQREAGDRQEAEAMQDPEYRALWGSANA